MDVTLEEKITVMTFSDSRTEKVMSKLDAVYLKNHENKKLNSNIYRAFANRAINFVTQNRNDLDINNEIVHTVVNLKKSLAFTQDELLDTQFNTKMIYYYTARLLALGYNSNNFKEDFKEFSSIYIS